MSTRRRLLRFGGALLLCTAAAAGLAVLGAGAALARPVAHAIGAPPRDLAAERVQIASASGSTLRGWLVPGRPGVDAGAVLLLHPLRGDRTSMLERARFLRAAGFTVLLFDFQAHGESPGARVTFGALEARDAHAALTFLRQRAPHGRVAAIGWSLGGAAALLGPAPLDVDALVLEAVYPTIEEAVADRLRLRLGAAGPLLAPLLVAQLRPRTGVAPAELRPVDAIARLRAPLLVIAGARDERTPLAESRRLFARAPAPKELWVVPGAAHVDLHAAAPAEYERRVLGFLFTHLAGPRLPLARLTPRP